MKRRRFIAGLFGACTVVTARAQQPHEITPTVYSAYDMMPSMAAGLMGANAPSKIPYNPATGDVDPAWLDAAGYPPGSTISDIRAALDALVRRNQYLQSFGG